MENVIGLEMLRYSQFPNTHSFIPVMSPLSWTLTEPKKKCRATWLALNPRYQLHERSFREVLRLAPVCSDVYIVVQYIAVLQWSIV